MKRLFAIILVTAVAINIYPQKRLDSLVQYSFPQVGDSLRNFKQEYSNYFVDDWQVNISYLWNKDKHEWIPTQKTEYLYVEDGKWTERYRYKWDTLSGDWVGNDHYIREWTDFGIVSNNLLQTWSIENEQWMDSWKQENSFFDDNTRVSQISHNWDSELNEWIPERITDYEFTEDFDIISYIQYLWSADDGRWNLSRKGEFDYDANTNRTDARYWSWDTEAGAWVNSSRYLYAYDEMENMTSYQYDAWNPEQGAWEFKSKTLREYDENSRKLLEEYYNADSEEIPLYRYVYDYNSAGQLISQQYYRRDTDGVTIINSNLDLYSYNSDVTVIIRQKHYWNKAAEDWKQYVSEVSYYSVLAGRDDIETNEILVYPNPTSGLINIDGLDRPCDIRIYTLQGRLVKTNYQVFGTADVSDLTPGMYILKVESGFHPFVQRVIIE